MKQIIALFYVRTASGFPSAVRFHHNPHPQGWGFLLERAPRQELQNTLGLSRHFGVKLVPF